MSYEHRTEFSNLIGKTLSDVTGLVKGGDQIRFSCSDGSRFVMLHRQDCCESVNIEDVVGDVADLIGSPIVLAEESTSRTNPPGVPVPEYQDSHTWTFYRIATQKGHVDIRWYGESNGWYGEDVDFERVP